MTNEAKMKKHAPKRTEPLKVSIPDHLRGRECASAVLKLLAYLNKVIEEDPEVVSAHHKELWRKQAKAMQEYVDVLGERIKDLIDND